MKITKEHVGKLIRGIRCKKPSRILCVTDYYLILDVPDWGEQHYYHSDDDDWELLPDPKPQGAPALIKDKCSPYWRVTDIVFPSEDWASEYLKSWDRVIWPALIDPKTGMYILPED